MTCPSVGGRGGMCPAPQGTPSLPWSGVWGCRRIQHVHAWPPASVTASAAGTRALTLKIRLISSISLLAFYITERYADLIIRFADGAPLSQTPNKSLLILFLNSVLQALTTEFIFQLWV